MAMQPINHEWPSEASDEVKELHTLRWRRVSSSRALSDRFLALQTRYEELSSAVKQGQTPYLFNHGLICHRELSHVAHPRVEGIFNWLRQMYHDIHEALVTHNLRTARFLVSRAKLAMREARHFVELAQTSLQVLERSFRASMIKLQYNELLHRCQEIDGNYTQLQNQWQAIHPLICEGARVSVLGLHVCLSAFEVPPRGVPAFYTSRARLEVAMRETSNAIETQDLDGAAMLLESAENQCGRLQQFILDLTNGVQEYTLAAARSKVVWSSKSKNLSSDGTRNTINLHLANSDSGPGFYSRAQMGFDYYWNQHLSVDYVDDLNSGEAANYHNGRRVQCGKTSSNSSTPESHDEEDEDLSPYLGFPEPLSPRTTAMMIRMSQYRPGTSPGSLEANQEAIDADLEIRVYKHDSGYSHDADVVNITKVVQGRAE